MVDGMVDVAHQEAVRPLVPFRMQVARRLLLAHPEDKLVDHVQLHLPALGRTVVHLDLVVLLRLVDGYEGAHLDGQPVVVLGVEGGPALRVARGGGEELPAVD